MDKRMVNKRGPIIWEIEALYNYYLTNGYLQQDTRGVQE